MLLASVYTVSPEKVVCVRISRPVFETTNQQHGSLDGCQNCAPFGVPYMSHCLNS